MGHGNSASHVRKEIKMIRDGKDAKVEVDAMSGNVLEVETEIYEVGDVCD